MTTELDRLRPIVNGSLKSVADMVKKKEFIQGLALSEDVLRRMHGVRQTRGDQENPPPWDFKWEPSDSETFSNYVTLVLVQRSICLANGVLGTKEASKTFSLCSSWLFHLKNMAANSKDKTLPEKASKYCSSYLSASQLICSRLQAQTDRPRPSSATAKSLISFLQPMTPIVCLDPNSALQAFFDSLFKLAIEYEKQGHLDCAHEIWNFSISCCKELGKKPRNYGKIYLPQFHLLALLHKANILTSKSDKSDRLPTTIQESLLICNIAESQSPVLYKMAFILGSIRKTFLQNCLPSLSKSAGPPAFPLPEPTTKLFESIFVLFSQIVVEYIGKVPDPKLEQFQWQPLMTAALSAFQSRRDIDTALSYLEKALTFIREKDCVDAIKNISGVYYNFALTLHKDGHASQAVHPAQMSFDLFEEWVTRSEDPDEDNQLFKREQFLNTCKSSCKPAPKKAPPKKAATTRKASSKATQKSIVATEPNQTPQANPIEVETKLTTEKNSTVIDISSMEEEDSEDYDESPLQEAAESLLRRLTKTKHFNLDSLLPFIKVFISKKKDLFASGSKKTWDPSNYLYATLRKAHQLTHHQIGSILQIELGFYSSSYFKEDPKLIGAVLDQLLSVFPTTYPVSRSRVLIQKAQQLYKEDPTAALKQAQQALKLCNETNYGHDKAAFEDASFVLDSQAVVCAWTGMISRKDPQSTTGTWMQYLDQAIAHWKNLLSSLKPGDEKNVSKFFSTDYTMQTMSFLSDLLDLLQEHQRQIQMLQLTVLMHERVLDKASPQIITLQAEIGSLCNRLGYVGMASFYFKQAERAVKQGINFSADATNTSRDVDWMIASSLFLYQIGELRSKEELLQTHSVLSASYLSSSRRTFPACLQLARFESMLAALEEREGNFELALAHATEAMTLLLSLIPERELVRSKKRHRNELIKTSSFNNWSILRDVLLTFNQIAFLYESQGSVWEAESHLMYALKLGDLLDLQNVQVTFLVKLAHLHTRKSETETADAYYAEAEKLLQKIKDDAPRKTGVQVFESIGDLMRVQGNSETDETHVNNLIPPIFSKANGIGNLDVAGDKYLAAEENLNQMMDRSYIMELVNILAQTRPTLTKPEVKKITRGRKKIISEDSEEFSLVKIPDFDKATDECEPLKLVQLRLSSKQGHISLLRGELMEAETVLEDCLQRLEEFPETKATLIDKMNLLYHLGKISLSKCQETHNSILNDIWSYNDDIPLETESSDYFEQAKRYFSQALECCQQSGSNPTLKVEICHALALISGTTDPQTTAAYLHMSIGTTLLRDEMAYLCRRLLFLKNELIRSDPSLKNVKKSKIMEESISIDSQSDEDSISELTKHLGKLNVSKSQEEKPMETDSTLVHEFELNAENPPEDIEIDIEVEIETLSSRRKLLQRLENQIYTSPQTFQADFVDSIPEDWTVVSLSLTSDKKHVLITRLQSGINRTPLVLRIPVLSTERPLKGVATSHGKPVDYYKTARTEFDAVMEESKTHLKESNKNKPNGEIDRYDWWERRAKLDGRLEKLLIYLQDSLFDEWKCVFMGSPETKLRNCFEEKLPVLVEKLNGLLEVDLCPTKMELLRCLFLSDMALSGAQIVRMIATIYQVSLKPTTKPGRDALKIFNECQKSAQLLSRGSSKKSTPALPNPVILILDRHFHDLPLECLPFLRNNPICRMPSILLIQSRLSLYFSPNSPTSIHRDGVNPKKMFYMINPDGSLLDTQNRIFEITQKLRFKAGTLGRKDRDILRKWFKSGLAEHDLFLYSGHNSGDQYFPRNEIRSLPRCAVALLMGCGSVSLETNGDFEPAGTLIAYMLCDSPATIGNLWTITGADLDKETQTLLETWMTKGGDLLSCLPFARNDTKLKNMNGAALVYYGLPSVVLKRR